MWLRNFRMSESEVENLGEWRIFSTRTREISRNVMQISNNIDKIDVRRVRYKLIDQMNKLRRSLVVQLGTNLNL